MTKDDLRKMAEQCGIRERDGLIFCANAEALARQVAEAVCDEAIKRVPYGRDGDMDDFSLGRRVGFGNAEAVLRALKREICGELKKEGAGNG
jgi:hypothetical protein